MKFLPLLAVFIAAGCVHVTQKKKDVAGWITYSGNGYSLAYPSKWIVEKPRMLGVEFIMYSRPDSSGDYRESINLLIQDLTGKDMDLDKYVALSESQVGMIVPNSAILKSERIKKGSDEYHEIIYTGSQGENHLKWMQHYRLKNEKAYILTYSATEEQYDNYIETADNVFYTFKLE